MQSQKSQEKNISTSVRTPYRAPKLERFGRLASLVQGGTSGYGSETSLYSSAPN